MNKAGLIEHLSSKVSGVSKKQVEDLIETLFSTIINELVAGKKVNLVGFGSFEARKRHARGGINPQNPSERITIPEVRVAKFKTGKTLKDALKGKISTVVETTTAESNSDNSETNIENN